MAWSILNTGTALVALVATASAQAVTLAPPLVASYSFAGTLAADQSGVAGLLAIDPQNKNRFETALVQGVSQTVYHWAGDGASAATQAGLTLDASGLLGAGSSYTVAMRFEFLTLAQTGGGWRRLIDTESRQVDYGFYVSPSQQLQTVQRAPGSTATVFGNGSTLFTTPGFHDLMLSVADQGDGTQQVMAWLDGGLELSTTTTTFNLGNANNAGRLLTLFADNLADGAQQEYADGRIASLSLYAGVVSPSAVPEPQAAALLLAGLLGLGLHTRRRRQR
jgi:hypothetical protein